MNVSGFSFVHNAIENGYPIFEAIDAISEYVDEMVFVDMASTDGTQVFLARLGVRTLPGDWIPGAGGACLAAAHKMHTACRGEVIWHFEGDEVFSPELAKAIGDHLLAGDKSLFVYRLQLEQNFQRCRWYPYPVHRIFERGKAQKQGHTTKEHWENDASANYGLASSYGFLWDFPVMCRDDWIPRMKTQAKLWGHEPKYRLTPYHFNEPKIELTEEEARLYLRDPIWTDRRSPFAIPPSVQPLVGKLRYWDGSV